MWISNKKNLPKKIFCKCNGHSKYVLRAVLGQDVLKNGWWCHNYEI
jgi:hypothetical protein